MQNKFHPTSPSSVVVFLLIITVLMGATLATVPFSETTATKPHFISKKEHKAPTTTATKSDKFYAPILMYHHISDTMPAGPYVIRPDRFEEQMAWLKDNNYHVITYAQFFNALTNKTTLPEKPVVITFDDNNKDQYQNALPILKKYGYSAMFFIPTAYIGIRGGVMDWDMIKTLVKDHMEIGSHSSTHTNLRIIPKKQLYDEELIGSKKILEEKLEIKVNFFAYPGGAKSNSVVQAVKDTGYLSALSTNYDPNHSYEEDRYRVSRIYVGNNMKNFIDFINGRNLYKSF